MLDRLTDSLRFQSDALVLRAQRQRLLASNIANADTPGYLARDMDFAAAMRQASQAGAPTLAVTMPGHMGQDGAGRPSAALNYALAAQTNLDRNSVDMDRERANFADNAVRYEATLRFINAGVRTALSAITGQ